MKFTASGARVTTVKRLMVGGGLAGPHVDAAMLGVAYGGESTTGPVN